MIHIVVPTQFFRQSDVRTDPHRRLMAAVLQTALNDRWGSAFRNVPRRWRPDEIRSVREATAYLASTDRAWPFSFENICEALGLDSAALRDELREATVT